MLLRKILPFLPFAPIVFWIVYFGRISYRIKKGLDCSDLLLCRLMRKMDEWFYQN